MDIEELLRKAEIARMQERMYCDMIAKEALKQLGNKDFVVKCEFDSIMGYVIEIATHHQCVTKANVWDFFDGLERIKNMDKE